MLPGHFTNHCIPALYFESASLNTFMDCGELGVTENERQRKSKM